MFKNLLNLFTPQAERKNNLSQNEQSGNPKIIDNIIDLKYNLINKIVEYFRRYYGISDFTNTLVIWVSDQSLQAIVKENTFLDSLRAKLCDNQLDIIADTNIIFQYDVPPESNNFYEIQGGILIEIRSKETLKADVFSKAKISIANKQGSLVKKHYIINGTIQTLFNIGRGSGENGHINHIVINADDETQKAKNNCVSRMHARIVFIENSGFYLQVLKGGARNQGGSATKIIRSDETIRIENIEPKVLLKNGDLIELGKAVLLKYEVIKQIDKA